MKTLFSKLAMGFAVMTFGLMSYAAVEAGAPAAPKDLGDVMKVMSTNLKAITAQAQDQTLNAQSAVLADQLVAATIQARTFIPKSISGLADKDQPAAKEQYLKMIDQAAELGKQLAASFRANDNVKAVDLLNQLVSAKKQGHTEFKQ